MKALQFEVGTTENGDLYIIQESQCKNDDMVIINPEQLPLLIKWLNDEIDKERLIDEVV